MISYSIFKNTPIICFYLCHPINYTDLNSVLTEFNLNWEIILVMTFHKHNVKERKAFYMNMLTNEITMIKNLKICMK